MIKNQTAATIELARLIADHVPPRGEYKNLSALVRNASSRMHINTAQENINYVDQIIAGVEIEHRGRGKPIIIRRLL